MAHTCLRACYNAQGLRQDLPSCLGASLALLNKSWAALSPSGSVGRSQALAKEHTLLPVPLRSIQPPLSPPAPCPHPQSSIAPQELPRFLICPQGAPWAAHGGPSAPTQPPQLSGAAFQAYLGSLVAPRRQDLQGSPRRCQGSPRGSAA